MSAITSGFDADDSIELVVGELYGERRFEQDEAGRLVGLYNASVFRPGVNVAYCLVARNAGESVRETHARLAARRAALAPGGYLRPGAVAKMTDCSCGYYAYFSGESVKSAYAGPVGAIIKGYGETVVGTKGFRCEKAELVALFPGKSKGGTLDDRRTLRGLTKFLYPTYKSMDNISSSAFVPLVSMLSMAVLVGAYLVLGMSAAQLFTPGETIDLPPAELAAPSLVVGLWSTGFLRRIMCLDKLSLERLTRGSANSPVFFGRKARSTDAAWLGDASDPTSFARLKKLYPDVPVYPTRRAALAVHPVSLPPEVEPAPVRLPDPETADGFWEKSASTLIKDGYCDSETLRRWQCYFDGGDQPKLRRVT